MKTLPVLRTRSKNKEIWLAQPVLNLKQAQLYASWLNDSKIISGIGGLEKISEEEAYNLMKKWREDPLSRHWFIYTYEKGSLVPIGDFNLDISFPDEEIYEDYLKIDSLFLPKKAEVKIMISKDYQKKGVGKLALNLGVNYGFFKENIDEIYALVYENNSLSISLFEKNGFRKIGFCIEKESERKEYVFKKEKFSSKN